MIEVEATVNLPRLPRGMTVVVDETDEGVKKRIRAGLLVPTANDLPPAKPKP